MTQSTLFATLLGAMLAAACSYALGMLFASLLSVRLTRLEGHLFRFLTGSAALSTLTFVLCTIHQARKGVFVAITVMAALLALRPKPQALESERPSGLSKAQWLCGAAIYLYFAWIYLVNAIAPEFSPDGATYHLGNVARWWRLFGFDDYAGSIYSMWSQGFEMLFLVTFSIGKHPAAAVVHCLFGLLLPALIYAYGRRIGRGWTFAVAGLLIFASPVVGRTASSAYNDIAVACLLFACFYLIEIWRAEQQPGLLAACGWLAGFAFAVKFTAIPALFYAVAIVLWQSPKQARLRHVALLIGFAIPTAAPWLIRNAIVYGNPFAPFSNRIFENPYVSATFEAEYAAAMSLYPSLHSRWQLPWNWAVEGYGVGGIFGPWILLLPLALIAIRNPMGQRLLLAMAMMGWPIFLNCGTRFLLPALLFATPAMLIGLQRLGIPTVAVLALHALLSIPQIVPLYAGRNVWRFEELPWRAALRMEPEEAFLSRKMGAFPIANEMERWIPLNAKTFSNAQLPLAYATRRVWHNWQSLEAVRAHRKR